MFFWYFDTCPIYSMMRGKWVNMTQTAVLEHFLKSSLEHNNYRFCPRRWLKKCSNPWRLIWYFRCRVLSVSLALIWTSTKLENWIIMAAVKVSIAIKCPKFVPWSDPSDTKVRTDYIIVSNANQITFSVAANIKSSDLID